MGRHADGGPPRAAAAATNSTVSPALNQRETIAGRLCGAVGGIMSAPRWSQALMLSSRQGGGLSTPNVCGAHGPSLVTVVRLFLFDAAEVVKVTDGSHSAWMDGHWETLADNTSDTCSEHCGSRILRGRHGSGWRSRNAVDGDRLGTDCTGSCLDGLQSSLGGCVKKRPWEDQTCGIEIIVDAGGDQIGKSEHEEGPRRATFGGPLDEGKIVARN